VATDPRVKRRQRQEAERLGQLLHDAREKAGLTQDEVAEQLGRPQQYLSAAELGRQRLDLWELLQDMPGDRRSGGRCGPALRA
jgi:DNA-binding XRE family transcriptional regulator